MFLKLFRGILPQTAQGSISIDIGEKLKISVTALYVAELSCCREGEEDLVFERNIAFSTSAVEQGAWTYIPRYL